MTSQDALSSIQSQKSDNINMLSSKQPTQKKENNEYLEMIDNYIQDDSDEE